MARGMKNGVRIGFNLPDRPRACKAVVLVLLLIGTAHASSRPKPRQKSLHLSFSLCLSPLARALALSRSLGLSPTLPPSQVADRADAGRPRKKAERVDVGACHARGTGGGGAHSQKPQGPQLRDLCVFRNLPSPSLFAHARAWHSQPMPSVRSLSSPCTARFRECLL